jgi:hypothetical protein
MPQSGFWKPRQADRLLNSWVQEDKGGTDMGDQGKKDKDKREQQKKDKHSSKEKRQLKREKKK